MLGNFASYARWTMPPRSERRVRSKLEGSPSPLVPAAQSPSAAAVKYALQLAAATMVSDSGDLVITWSGDAGGDHDEVSVDGGDFATETSPYTVVGTTGASHHAVVRRVDAVVNIKQESTTRIQSAVMAAM